MREVGRAEHASTEQLSALVDGRAEPDEQGFLAGHVEGCVACSNELSDLRTVRDVLRALPVYLPPRSFTIPIEAAPPARRFRRLIPLTRALGTVAAVLCVVLFSVDAMQTGYDAPASVPDGAAAMHLTTRATMEAAQATKPAEPRAAARAASESERSADAAPKIANAPAAPPAPAGAAKPAAAVAPAPTSAPPSTPLQSIANAVTATPAGILTRPAADAAASGRAESVAAASPPPAQPAAAAPAQPAPAQPAPGAPAKPQAQSAQAAPPASQPTSAAFAPGAPAPAALPAPAQRPAPTSPWLSPIRLWSLGFALVAAALLIGSLVLSRISRTRIGPRDEWTRS